MKTPACGIKFGSTRRKVSFIAVLPKYPPVNCHGGGSRTSHAYLEVNGEYRRPKPQRACRESCDWEDHRSGRLTHRCGSGAQTNRAFAGLLRRNISDRAVRFDCEDTFREATHLRLRAAVAHESYIRARAWRRP